MTLTEAFIILTDPRMGPAQRHDLREMILMALCAVLCGADTWVDVAEWTEDNEAWLKRYLVLAHGWIARSDALARTAVLACSSNGCAAG
ncbi:MAG: transposase family protein [Azoarcus sp.]|jgi:hypothetical protein|nr:transposase family protein [Azoarcus sp.]